MKQLHKLSERKMKAFLYLSFFIVVILATFVSCEKDFLEIVPKDSYTETVVFNDPDLATAHVNYAYRLICWGFRRPLQYARVSDEISGRGGGSSYWRILQGFATPTFNDLLNIWSASSYGFSKWPPIKQCNEFLYKTEGSKIDKAILDRLIGEAKTIRAYCYFRLASFYGGVPLIKKPFSLDDDWRVPRNSYDEVMQFVLSELDEAIPLLPLTYNAANNGRITKGAAMAIKARVLLFYASPLNNPSNDMSRYQKAADAAKAVIDLNQYQLYPDYKKLFQEAGAWNSEVIWARPTNSLIDQEARIEQLFYPNGERGFGQVHPIQNLVDDYEMLSGKLPKDDPTYDPQNPYVNRDPRFYYCILYNGAPFRGRQIETFVPGGMDSPEGPISGWNATETGYYPCKFITESYTGFGWETSNPPWIWFRYGEVLLNYAEAMFKLGHEDVARQYINMIRSRPSVNMPPVTESGEALWQRYIHERRIEMVFEEARFYDVRRWKIAEEVFSIDRNRMYITKDLATGKLTYEVKLLHTAYFPPHMYWAPIPQDEIDKNGLLEQNPGYD
jgi:hypothetical protein